jgi:hypothetical protein
MALQGPVLATMLKLVGSKFSVGFQLCIDAAKQSARQEQKGANKLESLSIPVAPVARGPCFSDVCLRLAGREPYTLTQVLQPGSIGRPIGNSVMFCSL